MSTKEYSMSRELLNYDILCNIQYSNWDEYFHFKMFKNSVITWCVFIMLCVFIFSLNYYSLLKLNENEECCLVN